MARTLKFADQSSFKAWRFLELPDDAPLKFEGDFIIISEQLHTNDITMGRLLKVYSIRSFNELQYSEHNDNFWQKGNIFLYKQSNRSPCLLMMRK